VAFGQERPEWHEVVCVWESVYEVLGLFVLFLVAFRQFVLFVFFTALLERVQVFLVFV
jgi:hypothetical protein